MITLKIKKSYTELYPNPSEKIYTTMKENIKKYGQIIPIYHNKKGYILDGYTRFKIANELKIKPVVELKEFSSEVEALEFIMSMNSQRRDLTTAQRFLIFEDYRQKLLKLNKEHTNSSNSRNPSPHGQSALVIAKKAGINLHAVERMIYVVNNGTKTDISELKDGAILWNVYSKVKARKQKSIDDEITKKEKELETIERKITENKSSNHDPIKQQWVECPHCNGTGKIWN